MFNLNTTRKLKPLERRVLPFAGNCETLTTRQELASRNIRPSQLVYRNYWWQIVDGPGIVEELHEFDDGSGPDPDFDFLTASLMGWNAFFEESNGTPSPFPQWRMQCNVGEMPMSRQYWLNVGFVDPAFADGASGKPWTAFVQIGFYGWKFTE